MQLRVTALSNASVPKDSDPAITFTAIDDRGQEQQSITFLGTFSRCDDPTPPKQFVSGKTYQSCLAYLIPGGGSIQKVQWDNGPAAANAGDPLLRPTHRVGLTMGLHPLPQEQLPGQAVEAQWPRSRTCSRRAT